MAENPALLVRVSTPAGRFTVPAATAARRGWKVLDQPAVDDAGRPLRPKPRRVIDPLEPRGATAAATPTPTEPEMSSGDTEETS